MSQLLARFVREEEGQDIVEYAFLLGFIAMVAVAAITILGTNLNTFFNNVATQQPLGGGS
ncbi:MAG: Flp family type IVb pilin [Vicinamibacterales bacterium]